MFKQLALMMAIIAPRLGDTLQPALVGQEQRIIYDKLTDIEEPNVNFPEATKVRSYKIEYAYN